jgi:hypothetical protein
MRAVTSDRDTGNHAENFLRVLDQFASLRTYSSAAPAVGGYRVLSSHREPRRQPQRVVHAPTVAARASARMRLTGFLSVLFVGGLGLAVLAGPANCPCSTVFAVADQASLSRLGYVQNAALVTAREFALDDAGLPPLTTAALIEPQESAVGVSPITTSALEPSRHVPTVKGDDLPATSVDRLPAKIEQVADAVPATIKLAAASIVDGDVAPTLPVIEVASPPMDDVTASELERVPVTKSRSARKRTPTRAYRTPNQQATRLKAKNSGAPQVAQSPKWAQQMFVTPWQTKAFSYMQ